MGFPTTKYLAEGIFFKLVLDNKGLYGGDEQSMKVGDSMWRYCCSLFPASSRRFHHSKPTALCCSGWSPRVARHGCIPEVSSQEAEATTDAARCVENRLAVYVSSLSVRLIPLRTVDYAGWRILASALLPIGNDTLVYGSDDGGKTVCALFFLPSKERSERMGAETLR